jgi:hypothetical protein
LGTEAVLMTAPLQLARSQKADCCNLADGWRIKRVRVIWARRTILPNGWVQAFPTLTTPTQKS